MRKSTSTDLTLVWPDLKSSPPTNTRCCAASSSAPGTSVFCGDPLRKAQPSRMLATAKSVDGDTSRPSCGRRWAVSKKGSKELALTLLHLACAHLNGVQQVLSCVVETRNHFAEALCVRCPQHDDLIQPSARSEVADVPTDLLQLQGG